MEFKKYSSLENAYRQKFIDHCHELGIKQWVALEKVHGCFVGNTKITLPDGSHKTIKEIVDSEFCGEVLGVDSSGALVPAKVTNWFNNGKSEEWLKIKFQSYGGKGGRTRTLTCTPNHRFFVDGDYIPAGELSVGDRVHYTYSGLSLSEIQKQVLVGKMLGDGSISNSAVAFCHKISNEGYLDYTLACLGGIAGNKQARQTSGFGTTMCRARSISSPEIDELFSDWDKSVGFVPELYLTPISLAFWYMDDGSLCESDCQRPRPKLHTCNFSEVGCENLVRSLGRLGITATVSGEEKRRRLTISADSAELFFSFVAPFLHKEMQYKVPEEYRGFGDKSLVIAQGRESKLNTSFAEITSIEVVSKRSDKYDIETETHNYFANNIHVHNSNFSFIVDETGDVTPAKRTSVIGKNAHGSYEFYGCNDVVNEYAPKVRELAERIGGPVVVYGELYGQGIQKEIDYGKKDFIAFDIMTKDDEFLLHDDVVSLCNEVGIPTTPEVGRGSLEDMLSISPEINSIVAPGEQTAEGLVIKPLDVDARLGNGSRAIIKNKSKAFSEKKDRTPKKPFKLPDSVKTLFDDFCQYLNENRLNNVLSKIGKVTQKDFGMVTGALIQDAKDEFERDEYEIAKDDWKLIAKSVGKEASNVVRSQWLNILDKEN